MPSNSMLDDRLRNARAYLQRSIMLAPMYIKKYLDRFYAHG